MSNRGGNIYPELDMTETVEDFELKSEPTRKCFKALTKPDFVIVYKAFKEKGCLEIFLRQLEEIHGLNVKKLLSSTFHKNSLVYAVISAPREVLAERAEKLKISCPLQLPVATESTRAESYKKLFSHYFSPILESGFYKIPYAARYEEYLHSSAFTDGDPLLTSRIRITLISDIIKDVDITSELTVKEPDNPILKCDEYRGLRWLEENKYIEDSFALHSNGETKVLARTVLSGSSWYKPLSLTTLRNYFGEKVGLSFAWRSAWLSNSLGPLILFGLITMIYGLAREDKHYPHVHNRTFGGKSSIEDTYLAAMNNAATPYYALLMCIWATVFPKIWSSFKYIYSFKWGTVNYVLFDERKIVKFIHLKRRTSLTTYFVFFCTWACTFFSMVIGVVYCLAILYVQAALIDFLNGICEQADLTANAIVSFVNTVMVNLVVNPMFVYISMKLTALERHHFDSDFERALTTRVFFNSFLNYNIRILLMLIAPRFTLKNMFTKSNSDFVLCKEGQCAEAIGYQVAFFLLLQPVMGLVKYVWHTARAMVISKRISMNQSHSCDDDDDDEECRLDSNLLTFVEEQHSLFYGQRLGEKFTTMEDMNARVAQYGFVVMFAAAFPLAPIIAFIAEYFVRRADIDRYITKQRRPIPRRQEGLGSWEDIVEFVNMAAICTNVWIIAFRTNYGYDLIIEWKKYYPNDYQAMLSVVLISFLVLLTSGIRVVSQYTIIPEKVKIFQRQEKIAVKEFFKENTPGDGKIPNCDDMIGLTNRIAID